MVSNGVSEFENVYITIGALSERIDSLTSAVTRIEALATILVARDEARERDMAREYKFTDEALAAIRLETGAMARRLESVRARAAEAKQSADDSTQRLALDSAHAIERLSEHEIQAARRLEDKADKERAKLEDPLVKRKAEHAERSKGWFVLAGIVIAGVLQIVGGIITYAVHR